jgi:hypothetical protein
VKSPKPTDDSKGSALPKDAASKQGPVEQPSNEEIERERAKWTAKQRKEHLELVKRLSFHASSTFMDYLHGDVAEEEAETACRYEYARESKMLRAAAVERDRLRALPLDQWVRPPYKKEITYEDIALQVVQDHPGDWFATDLLAIEFLICPSFPSKDWQDLSAGERRQIMRFFGRKKLAPLYMRDLWNLKAFGILEKFQAMAEAARPVIKNVRPGEKPEPMKLVWPVLEEHAGHPFFHVIFTMDLSKGETRLVNEFREWLRLPENRTRMEKFKTLRTGTTGEPLDRLKDLAAWRLFRELDNDWNAANEFANKHRKTFNPQEIREYKTKEQRQKYRPGDPKPFHNAKRQEGRPANEAELFGEDADAREAQAAAWEYSVQIMAEEFAPPSPHMLSWFVELGKLAPKG